MERIIIFTDGASKGNPGPGGWGAIVSDGAVRELGGRDEHTTNNRMELTAAIEALRYASNLGDAPITVYADSAYVMNGATKWVKGWQARGWQTQQKQEVLNRDLWERLIAAIDACGGNISWEYVGGHVGVAGNERADQIASDFADGGKVTLYTGPRKGYSVAIENILHDAAKQKIKSASRARSKQKAHSYVSEVNGVVHVHKTWAECEARVRGKKARYKKALSAEDEAAIIQQFSK